MNAEDLKQFVDLSNQYLDSHANWLKQMMALSVGALTLLVGLGPKLPNDPTARYFFAAALVGMGSSILFGCVATYWQVYSLKSLRDRFAKQLLEAQAQQKPKLDKPVLGDPGRFYKTCGWWMVISWVISVVCLVTYAVLATLDFQP